MVTNTIVLIPLRAVSQCRQWCAAPVAMPQVKSRATWLTNTRQPLPAAGARVDNSSARIENRHMEAVKDLVVERIVSQKHRRMADQQFNIRLARDEVTDYARVQRLLRRDYVESAMAARRGEHQRAVEAARCESGRQPARQSQQQQRRQRSMFGGFDSDDSDDDEVIPSSRLFRSQTVTKTMSSAPLYRRKATVNTLFNASHQTSGQPQRATSSRGPHATHDSDPTAQQRSRFPDFVKDPAVRPTRSDSAAPLRPAAAAPAPLPRPGSTTALSAARHGSGVTSLRRPKTSAGLRHADDGGHAPQPPPPPSPQQRTHSGRSFQELKDLTHIDKLSKAQRAAARDDVRHARRQQLTLDTQALCRRLATFYGSIDDFNRRTPADNRFEALMQLYNEK